MGGVEEFSTPEAVSYWAEEAGNVLKARGLWIGSGVALCLNRSC